MTALWPKALQAMLAMWLKKPLLTGRVVDMVDGRVMPVSTSATLRCKFKAHTAGASLPEALVAMLMRVHLRCLQAPLVQGAMQAMFGLRWTQTVTLWWVFKTMAAVLTTQEFMPSAQVVVAPMAAQVCLWARQAVRVVKQAMSMLNTLVQWMCMAKSRLAFMLRALVAMRAMVVKVLGWWVLVVRVVRPVMLAKCL